MDRQAVIDATRRWIETMVIGLNLCPFAQRVFQADKIRYVVSAAMSEKALLMDLTRELQSLAAIPISAVETTLLIHPQFLNDFIDFNDFLDPAEQRLAALGLEGVIQLASFHPHYQFAGTEPDAVENFTNRSPYPTLHLLREESISNIAADDDELLAIPERNIETLSQLGREKLLERLKFAAEGERPPS
jgi:hypothetical protein